MEPKDFYEFVVLGAGLSGLSAGHELYKAQADVVIIEGSHRAGGVIESQVMEGFTVESGANSMVLTSEIDAMCEELGISDQIIPAKEGSKARQILWDDQLHTLKASPLALLTTGLISTGAKLRLLKEPFIKSKSPAGESVLDFFTRRFGPQVARRMAGAIVSGIYAGDPEKLEMASVFPRFVQLEKKYGSLLKGLFKEKSAPRQIISFPQGVETLTRALSNALADHLLYGRELVSVSRALDHWVLAFKDGSSLKAKNVISTLPSYAIQEALRQLEFPALNLAYHPMWTLQVKMDLQEFQQKTTGFGFLASPYERKDFIGVLYNGNVFDTGIAHDQALMTFFVRPDHCTYKNSQEILEKVCIPLVKKWTGINSEIIPVSSRHWPSAIPQKTIGHHLKLQAVNDWQKHHPHFYIAGNFIYGVSLGDCVKDHQALAKQVLSTC